MRVFGVLLIILGVLAFAYGGIDYTKREEVLHIGSLRASVKEQKHLPIPPIAGGAAILVGLFFVARRPSTA